MNCELIKDIVSAAFPQAQIEVQGQDGKFSVKIIDQAFVGLSRVKRQQRVYRVLNEHITSGAIHAISMQLETE